MIRRGVRLQADYPKIDLDSACVKERQEILLHREGQQYSHGNICLYMVLASRFDVVFEYI